MRGTTPLHRLLYHGGGDFNSRAPCGARLEHFLRSVAAKHISTHVPRAGHDRFFRRLLLTPRHFNSRAPCGARLTGNCVRWSSSGFQLTCPMRGTTYFMRLYTDTEPTFQLTCPMRGTTVWKHANRPHVAFQLTCPMRGTTKRHLRHSVHVGISTHVPHAGHDTADSARIRPAANFNSRAPCGARRASGT